MRQRKGQEHIKTKDEKDKEDPQRDREKGKNMLGPAKTYALEPPRPADLWPGDCDRQLEGKPRARERNRGPCNKNRAHFDCTKTLWLHPFLLQL